MGITYIKMKISKPTRYC